MDFNSAIMAKPFIPTVPTDTKIAMETIRNHVARFQSTLDQEHDVGLMLTNLGTSVLMEVREISVAEAHIIVFKGRVNGIDSTLIQHISQLNFLLTAIPKPVDKPRNVIGFRTE